MCCWMQLISPIQIELFRIDVLICPELAAYYKINSLPTIVAFHRSRLLTRLEGFADDKQLDNLIDLLVNRSVIWLYLQINLYIQE